MSLDSIQPFFIVGAQRSGTTLLRLMLNAHPLVTIPEEGTFWMPLLRDYGRKKRKLIPHPVLEAYLNYIHKNSQFELWLLDDTDVRQTVLASTPVTLSKMMALYYDEYRRSQKKTLVGDKTPSFFRMVPELSHLFPNAKFIHLVRDGRDIYLSLRKMGYKDNISVGAMEWGYKVNKAQRDLKALDSSRVLTLRYEDLLAGPKEQLQKICSFLTIDYDPNMLDFWKSSHKFIGIHHSKKIFGPIAQENINKWKTQLTTVEIAKFQKVAGEHLKQFSYEVTIASTNSLRCIIDLAYGVPIRLARAAWTAVQLKIASQLGLRTDAAGKGALPHTKLEE